MKNPTNRSKWSRRAAILLAAATPFAFLGCGGGAGGGEEGPAPRVLNGLVFSLTTGGPVFEFISVDDFETDDNPVIDSGIVIMTPNPQPITSVTSTNDVRTTPVAQRITDASYSYRVTSGSQGTLTISGTGTNIDADNDIANTLDGDEYLEGEFVVQYDILFAANGGAISAQLVRAEETGQEGTGLNVLGILFNNSTLLTRFGGPVPQGYGIQQSRSFGARTIYPARINFESLVFTLDPDPTDPMATSQVLRYDLLDSTYTPFSDFNRGLEQGQGQCRDSNVPGVVAVIDFSWLPGQFGSDKFANNIATFTSVDELGNELIYEMTFASLDPNGNVVGGSESGVFFRSDGATGTFAFPFLDNALEQ